MFAHPACFRLFKAVALAVQFQLALQHVPLHRDRFPGGIAVERIALERLAQAFPGRDVKRLRQATVALDGYRLLLQ